MVDLVKYIVEQFAEHKEDIVYDVNERENAVDITVCYNVEIKEKAKAE